MKRLIISGIFLIIFILVTVRPGFSISPQPRYYTVEKGDYLIILEKKCGVPWKKIKEANGLTSNTIYPGQKLLIPWEGIWYTVRKGDFLIALERKYGVSWREIKEANALTSNKIYPGQKLFIPGAKEALEIEIPEEKLPLPQEGIYHIVRKGDFLIALERKYGVSWREIKEANALTSSKIYPGQKLFISGVKEALEIEIPEEKLPLPQEGIYHTVKEGETIYRIALNYGKNRGLTEKEMEKEIMEANNISDPTKLKPAEKLFIPGAKKVLEIEIPPELVTKEEIPSAPPPPELEEEKPIFLWPVEGEIIEYFGERGLEHIGIAAPEGEIVVAPAKGIVLERKFLQGYGETLVIEHIQEGLYTCYFHLLDYLVEKSAQVKKGQPIAKVGMSGTVDVPCLRFQVRKIGSEDETVNPLDYLP